MSKIVIVNAHWNNRGDEAALRAIIDTILECIHSVKITIIFKDGQDVNHVPYDNSVVTYFSSKYLPYQSELLLQVLSNGILGKNTEMKRDIREIKTADMILYSPGGSVINDRFWWRKQLEYMLPFMCAKRNKLPVFVAAPSIGPFYKNKWFRNWMLNVPDVICVREKISEENILSVRQVPKNKIYTVIDAAFINEIDEHCCEQKLTGDQGLKKFFVKYDKIIGITITDFSWHIVLNKNKDLKDNIKKSFEKFISFLNDKNIGVILIPQLFGNQNDRTYLLEYAGNNVFVMSDAHDSYLQQYVISKLWCVVGMRYHSNIFAAKMGVPFIPIIYEEKMKGFVDFFDWENQMIDIEDLSYENLVVKFNYIENNRDKLKADMRGKRDIVKKKSQLLVNLLEQFITNNLYK